MILQKEKAAYYSNNSQDQKGDNYDDAETTQTGSSKEDNRKHAAAPAIIPTDIMEVSSSFMLVVKRIGLFSQLWISLLNWLILLVDSLDLL